MVVNPPPLNVDRKKHFFCVFLLCIYLFFPGCEREKERTIVDFSRTVPVARPGSAQKSGKTVFRVAVGAMTSPRATLVFYKKLLDYLGEKLGENVVLVQRKTYGELDQAIENENIDFAFICSGPYVAHKNKCGYELLATPRIHGSHYYYSYLIVNRDSPYERLEDLKGKVFAFTDPDSNTGKLVPTYWIGELHETPDTFFKKTIYTFSHDNSILAVARGLVDGAAVDSLIWEYYNLKDPELTNRTRVIRKSQPFGIPPIVASRSAPLELKKKLRRILLSMHGDPDGRKILNELMIDRFVIAHDEWYDNIRELEEKIFNLGTLPR